MHEYLESRGVYLTLNIQLLYLLLLYNIACNGVCRKNVIQLNWTELSDQSARGAGLITLIDDHGRLENNTAEKNNEDLAVTDLNNNNTFKYYTKA